MDRCKRRFILFTLAHVLAGSCAFPAMAQDYPKRAVHIVVPFPAGGAMDVATRILVSGLQPALAVPVVVENRPGASGNIGTAQVVQAAADGYTLLLGIAANIAINRFLYKSLPFDTDRDLVPVAQFGTSTNVIYTSLAFPAKDLKSLLQRLREAPGRENYASPGIGTTPHLGMELLKLRSKTYVVHIPFNGSSAAVQSVVSGDVNLGVDAVIAVMPAIRGGRVRPIAVTGAERSFLLPDVPTLRELGLDVESSTFLGVFAPARTPPAVLERLTREVEAALRKEEVSGKLRQAGVDPVFASRDRFAERIRRELSAWKDAVAYSGAANF